MSAICHVRVDPLGGQLARDRFWSHANQCCSYFQLLNYICTTHGGLHKWVGSLRVERDHSVVLWIKTSHHRSNPGKGGKVLEVIGIICGPRATATAMRGTPFLRWWRGAVWYHRGSYIYWICPSLCCLSRYSSRYYDRGMVDLNTSIYSFWSDVNIIRLSQVYKESLLIPLLWVIYDWDYHKRLRSMDILEKAMLSIPDWCEVSCYFVWRGLLYEAVALNNWMVSCLMACVVMPFVHDQTRTHE